MNPTRLAFVFVSSTLVSTAAAQSPACASGSPNTRSESYTWVEPQPLAVVAQVITTAIPDLGYSFQDPSNSSNRWVTEPKWSWPHRSSFTGWRELTYPGAQLRISIDSAGPGTRISLHTRLLCATGQRPPPTHFQDVDFDVFVLDGTHSEAQIAMWTPLSRKKVRQLARSCEPLPGGDRTIEICARIAAARPDDAEAQRQHALALAGFYRASKAWTPLKRLFELEGEQRSTYDTFGVVMLSTNQFDDARKLHERAIVLWPSDVAFRLRLARVNLELRHFQEAADGFLHVLAADTAFAESHYYAAVAFAALDRPDESQTHCRTGMQALKRSLPRRATDAQIWLGLAYCAAMLQQDREAVAYFARAERVDFEQARLAADVRRVVAQSFERVGDQPPAPIPSEPH